MEVTGTFVATTFIIKPVRWLLVRLHHDGRRTCQFQPSLVPRHFLKTDPRGRVWASELHFSV